MWINCDFHEAAPPFPHHPQCGPLLQHFAHHMQHSSGNCRDCSRLMESVCEVSVRACVYVCVHRVVY